MSRRGNCYDNAVMESFFSGLKLELGERFETHRDAKDKLFDHIEVFYNQQRRHSAIGYASPAEFREGRTVEVGGVVRLSTEPDQAHLPFTGDFLRSSKKAPVGRTRTRNG